MERVKCTLCGNEEVLPINNSIRNVTDDILKMYQCTKCHTHFIYPLPKETELEAYYDGEFRAEVHTKAYYEKSYMDNIFNNFTPEAKIRVKRVLSELKESDDILEVGTSVGYFLSAISEHVHLAYGTEWDSGARGYIEEVIANPKIKTAKNPWDFEQKFDKIFMFHVLEHIEYPVEFLQRLKKQLKTCGKIYIEVPNVDDIMVKTFENDAFKNFYYKKAHIFNFNEVGLNYIFDLAGFKSEIRFIQRYDLSNHFHWLAKGLPSGNGYYKNILSNEVNEEYVKCLVKAKQTDTLFAVIELED
ncbi:Methyltransferase domain-containing protein [Anaerosporobacter mobilis DSM 15930]|jgi:SAM-dependent methyltransferase|uniref:Methyltransferase domain-containing protein n=1 Tax=Anaerosporobacter mobilis DSM 15930 TaxID=1120996 RepID=A0A1M7LP48_9FIRM|nr:class I SAM-dependent methyltransferase [Anaerosporobacter mobilis]SHM79968.1 Methyltransferase domain-containing protein [Anaerosporobacter mobilis DSM 15930]